MLVKKVGSKWGVFEGGVQIAEFRNQATALLWDQLPAREQDNQCAKYSAHKEAAATGLPMRGKLQAKYAYAEAARRAGR